MAALDKKSKSTEAVLLTFYFGKSFVLKLNVDLMCVTAALVLKFKKRLQYMWVNGR